jgi:hypothetical protein
VKKPIADHYVFIQSDENDAPSEAPPIQKAARFQYPESLLKHSYVPFGADEFDDVAPPAMSHMDVDVVESQAAAAEKEESDRKRKSEDKSKKRKKDKESKHGKEHDSPKKHKKIKVAS